MDTTADVIENVTHAAQEAAGETVGKVTNEFVHFLLEIEFPHLIK